MGLISRSEGVNDSCFVLISSPGEHPELTRDCTFDFSALGDSGELLKERTATKAAWPKSVGVRVAHSWCPSIALSDSRFGGH